MSQALEVPRTGFRFSLRVRSGPDAGAVYQLLPPRVSIGREKSANDITLNDPKVSRQAIVIEFSPQEILAHDIGKKGKLLVNGQSGDSLPIKGGDLIAFGDTELEFLVDIVQIPIESKLPSTAPAPRNSGSQKKSPQFSSAMLSANSAKKSPMTFYFILAGIFAVAVYLASAEKINKKLDKGLKSTSEIEKEITVSEQRIEAAAKKRVFRTEEEKTRYEEAQRHYTEGFRDYQKGNYSRAMRSFETARAIDPDHQLSLRYYKLAEKQRDESITALTLEGRRYLEKDMFTRCSAALEKALLLMPNKEDIRYRQVMTMKKECDLLQDGRYDK